jgi:hypothetical protein
MRLVGATPHQINVIASVDAISASLLGAVLGSVIFLAIRPAIADISFSGVKFFPNYVTPSMWGYAIMIVGVPIIAAIASLISLRRVQISPLGVSRKTTPPKPRAWRLIPLVVGIVLFPYAANHINNGGTGKGNPAPTLYRFPTDHDWYCSEWLVAGNADNKIACPIRSNRTIAFSSPTII